MVLGQFRDAIANLLDVPAPELDQEHGEEADIKTVAYIRIKRLLMNIVNKLRIADEVDYRTASVR